MLENRGREKGQEVRVLQQQDERGMGGNYSKMVNTFCHSI